MALTIAPRFEYADPGSATVTVVVPSPITICPASATFAVETSVENAPVVERPLIVTVGSVVTTPDALAVNTSASLPAETVKLSAL